MAILNAKTVTRTHLLDLEVLRFPFGFVNFLLRILQLLVDALDGLVCVGSSLAQCLGLLAQSGVQVAQIRLAKRY